MTPTEAPQAAPDHTGRPHLTRTAVLLALTGACIVAIAYAGSLVIGPAHIKAPVEYTVPAGSYTPFTQAPSVGR